VSGNAIKQRQRFVVVCPSYKAVMLQHRIKKSLLIRYYHRTSIISYVILTDVQIYLQLSVFTIPRLSKEN